MGQRPQQGVRSVEIGLALVAELAAAGRDMSLKELAQAADLAPAKAHRYLVSLGRARLIARTPDSGDYGLGPLAVNLGLSALARLDTHRVAWDELARLRDTVDQTAVKVIWGDGLAVVARVEQPARTITVNVRTGATLPILAAASARVFAAYLPNAVIGPIIERELAAGDLPTHMGRQLDRRGYQALLNDIRGRGMARSEGDLHAGIAALSAPVFDHAGRIAMVFALIGPMSTFDLDWKGRNARALAEACARLSERLGFRAPHRSQEQESPQHEERPRGRRRTGGESR